MYFAIIYPLYINALSSLGKYTLILGVLQPPFMFGFFVQFPKTVRTNFKHGLHFTSSWHLQQYLTNLISINTEEIVGFDQPPIWWEHIAKVSSNPQTIKPSKLKWCHLLFILQVSPMMIKKLRLRTLASHPETPRSQRFESPGHCRMGVGSVKHAKQHVGI